MTVHGNAAPASEGTTMSLARECGRYVWDRNPYLRLLAVSGSLTRPDHQGRHDDADYFAVTKQGRVWQAFFACLVLGWRFARSRGWSRKLFCFNYLVDESHPEEIDLTRSEYVVEFLRLEVIAGHATYLNLLDKYQPRLESCQPALYLKARERTSAELSGDGRHSSPQGGIPRAASSASEVETSEVRQGGSPNGQSSANEVSMSGERVVIGGVFYTALKLPFTWLARRMEGRRRRLYPGGHIYSNGRVIRSHFRRAWGASQIDPDALPAAMAFSGVAASYDDHFTSSPSNKHMRGIVRRRLSRLLRPGMRVLDLGCGTGIDAVWLAKQGASVLAVDLAQGMLEVTARRATAEGVHERVEVRRLAIEQLADLLPANARTFDLVLANFGALNIARDADRLVPVLARLLKPDGRLVASLMNRFDAWELFAGLLRMRTSFAFRRLRGDPARVGNIVLPVRLYSPSSFSRHTRRYFETEHVAGLCTFVPPPTLEHLGRIVPGEWRVLSWLDVTLGALPFVRASGDHFLVELRKNVTLFDRWGFGSVTASPVVADVNGDGIPEVVVAAGSVHVMDSEGRHLRGWPRRLGGPIASTPAIGDAGGSATILAGSDDDRLYALGIDGVQPPGFPFRTGGDVFSSPLLVGRNVVFGSDDGKVYAVDPRGRVRSGWPVETGGFVSASPVPVPTGQGIAIAIGSWDGYLYLVDEDGKTLPGWPQKPGLAIWSSAAVADIDGDGEPEVLVATDKLFAFKLDGTAVRGFPAMLGAYAVGSAAVGDIDLDGRLEIVIASDMIYAFRPDGTAVDGFPFDTGSYVWASPILVDVDGDGHPEIVVGDFEGRLWAINWRGEVRPGHPSKLGNKITAAAVAADVDGDGFLELIVATGDGRIKAYQTECANSVEQAPWPTFLAGRSRLLKSRLPVTASTVIEAAATAGAAPVSRLAGDARPSQIARPSDTTPSADNARSQVTRSQVGRFVQSESADGVRVEVSMPPFATGEVRLALPEEIRQSNLRVFGMLYYAVDGRLHPSPLLRNGSRYFALVQPLPPLKEVAFSFTLQIGEDQEMRVPRGGSYRYRVGIPRVTLASRSK